ncbi:MAG TPA: hypothetical protein VF755_11205 [Catenuloplanes sp.]
MDNRRPGLRSTLSAVLALALLVPIGILFSQVWRTTTDDISVIQKEHRGVEYLTSLGQLLNATSQTQATALQGQAPPESLRQAVARTAEADQRLGTELETHERWAALRAKIEKLPRATAGQEFATYQAHTEVSELLLALFRTVRVRAGLAHDQQTDVVNLQQAVGDGLPNALVRASRLADLIALAPKANATQRQQVGLGLGVTRQEVSTAVEAMTDNLQTAADETRSATLSGAVLGALDRFRLAVDGLIQGATTAINAGATPAQGGTADPTAGLAQLATIRAGLQVAANDLTTISFQETDVLLDNRLDELRARQRTALITAAAAVLLALAAILVPILGRRRRAQHPVTVRARPEQPATTRTRGEPPTATAEPPPVPAAYPSHPAPDGPAGPAHRYADDATARWERDDVLR